MRASRALLSLLGARTLTEPVLQRNAAAMASRLAFGIAHLVDSRSAVEQMLADLATATQLAIDAEGCNLSREGKLCLLAIAPGPAPAAEAPASPVSAAATATTASSSPSGTAAAAAAPPTTTPCATTASPAATLHQAPLLPPPQAPPLAPPDPQPPPPPPQRPPVVYLLDVTVLRGDAFTHAPPGTPSLGHLLANPAVTKLLYDCRADVEALHAQHGLRLAGVMDLQLAEVAFRRYGSTPPRRVSYVVGLAAALERYLGPEARAAWRATAVDKRAAHALFDADHGYWDRRPLTQQQVRYAADDVVYLHRLHESLVGALSPEVLERVREFSQQRVQESEAPAPAPTAAEDASCAAVATAEAIAAPAAAAAAAPVAARGGRAAMGVGAAVALLRSAPPARPGSDPSRALAPPGL